jgi:ribosomal protein S18 acetylase RimI-like enzyme
LGCRTGSIRGAVLCDARDIAVVQVAAWRAAYRGLLPDEALDRLSIEEVAGRWRERLARLSGGPLERPPGQTLRHVLVAEREGSIVGFAACAASRDADVDRERVGELYVLYVHPASWRQGYGGALLDEAMARLRDDGFEASILWVLQGNQQAIAFYGATGFAADGAHKVKRRADGVRLPVVRYRRLLAAASDRELERDS